VSEDRIFALVALVSILLWVGGGQLADPRMRRLARRGAYAVLAVGLVMAIAWTVLWLAG
jgi:hypothetical protein